MVGISSAVVDVGARLKSKISIVVVERSDNEVVVIGTICVIVEEGENDEKPVDVSVVVSSNFNVDVNQPVVREMVSVENSTPLGVVVRILSIMV